MSTDTEKLETINPKNFTYANVLKKLGRIAEARAEYQEALRIEPTYKDARANLDALNQEASK